MRIVQLKLLLAAWIAFAAVAHGQSSSWGSSSPQIRQEPWGSLQYPRQEIRVDIYLPDTEFNGDEYLPLRALLSRQQPSLKLEKYDVTQVRAVAKSRHGYGTIGLLVNKRLVDQVRVPGWEGDYFQNHVRTFTTLNLRNETPASDGQWILLLNGNVKLRQLTVTLRENGGWQDPGPRPAPAQWVTLGAGQFDKFVEDRHSYQTRIDRAIEVRVVALDHPIRIHEIRVSFSNGEYQIFPIRSVISGRQDVRLPLGGRGIRLIEVIGTSLEVVGSRGDYQVQVLAQDRLTPYPGQRPF